MSPPINALVSHFTHVVACHVPLASSHLPADLLPLPRPLGPISNSTFLSPSPRSERASTSAMALMAVLESDLRALSAEARRRYPAVKDGAEHAILKVSIHFFLFKFH